MQQEGVTENLHAHCTPQSQVWIVAPTRAPFIFSACSRCDRRQIYKSTNKFRVNAQKQRLDVWLIYKCADCDNTLNIPVHERKPVASLPQALFEEYTSNDLEAAVRIGNDLPRIWSLGYETDEVPYSIEKQSVVHATCLRSITITPIQPICVRIDKVLSDGLGLSRTKVSRMIDEGVIASAGGPVSWKRSRMLEKSLTLNIAEDGLAKET